MPSPIQDPLKKSRESIEQLLREWPVPAQHHLDNLPMFLGRLGIQNILLMDALYRQILGTHGVIMEFGVRFGLNTALLVVLRGIYEPYVRSRKIVAFDTFAGFPSVDEGRDGRVFKPGDLRSPEGYEVYLDRLLSALEMQSPIAHLKKYELVKGDIDVTLDQYFQANPETIVAFAYIDVDLYKPTRKCLEGILPRMTKGGIIAFDEVNYPDCPGETLAFLEVLGSKYQLRRTPLSGSMSYVILD
jgi:Macrocin-O-methyltransferase (TylF)